MRRKASPETLRKVRLLIKKWEIEDGIPQETPKPATGEHAQKLIQLFGKKKGS